MARLLVDVLAENRQKGRLLLHDFVIMPNHFHLPAPPHSDGPVRLSTEPLFPCPRKPVPHPKLECSASLRSPQEPQREQVTVQ